MKNTVVLLCSNIILQEEKKIVLFKTTHQVLAITKSNTRLRFEKENKLSAEKSYN